MFVEQFVDNGLGNSAYLVGSHESHLAVLIDPLRDVDRYLSTAQQMGATLKYVLETHLHNDFISGAREIAAKTKAQVGASVEAGLGFEHTPLADGDLIALGPINLNVLATPGHTPEHISFLLVDVETNQLEALFSGGALIVGGAARTDLLGVERAPSLARQLFHSLHEKLLTLPDDLIVYPTHGAGSFCTASSGGEPRNSTTIGAERKFNPLAQCNAEVEFIQRALAGLPSYPRYFHEMRAINQRGPALLGGVPSIQPVSSDRVHERITQGTVILDIRRINPASETYIPGAYRIPLTQSFISWAGWLIPFGCSIIIVSSGESDRLEAVRQLILIGYDRLEGYLEGGMAAWEARGLPVERLKILSVTELHERLEQSEGPIVLDIRQDNEWAVGHIPGALHIENGRLPYDDLNFPLNRPIAVHCQTQNRSLAGVSVLARRGYQDLWLVKGGFSAWQAAGYPIERD